MQADPLAQLRDIQLPEPISWWPLALGWWVLIVLAVGVLGWVGLLLIRRYRANLYRRQAIHKLAQIKTQPDFTSNQKLVLVFETLKQTINSAYPQQSFSSRDINGFVEFLQLSCKVSVFKGLPTDLNSILYGKDATAHNSNELLEKLLISAEIWIAKHYSQSKLQAVTSC
tara:strand:- start:1948 stop:2457 length:510 start_codon:yes stop_codon:yes gene_type:complete